MVIELRLTSTGMVTYKVVFHQHSVTLQLPFSWLNGRNISVTIFYIKWWLMINKYSLLLPVYNCLCLRESTIHILELNEVHFFFLKEKWVICPCNDKCPESVQVHTCALECSRQLGGHDLYDEANPQSQHLVEQFGLRPDKHSQIDQQLLKYSKY